MSEAGAGASDRLMLAPEQFAITLVLAALLAGCGDDGGSDVTVDADSLVPSKRDYIVQADTICANVQQGIETQAEISSEIGSKRLHGRPPAARSSSSRGGRPSDAEIESFGAETVVPAFREQLADLRGADPAERRRGGGGGDLRRGRPGHRCPAGRPVLFADSDAVRAELAEAAGSAGAYGFFDCGTYSAP